jgi:hypothetical protein
MSPQENATGLSPFGYVKPAENVTGVKNATEVNPFGYFKPADATLPLIQETRNAYSAVHKFLLTLPASRQRAIAITELETSAMWAIKGLVLNHPGSTQPNESGGTGS